MSMINSHKSLLTAQLSLSMSAITFILCCLFFISGCAALIYQIMWERMLFTLFGTDLMSITIIVSVFMFGLGIGGLIGGWIADNMRSKLLTVYIVIEISIALFGIASPYLIKQLALFTSYQHLIWTGLSGFLILSVPTILMGATFPILVTYIHAYFQNIGRSVGAMYFANTLGGALGAFFSGFVLLYCTGITGSIYYAASLNTMAAFSAFLLFRKLL